jgi:hypothetical protein
MYANHSVTHIGSSQPPPICAGITKHIIMAGGGSKHICARPVHQASMIRHRETEDDVAPTQTEDDVAPTHTEDYVAPTHTEDDAAETDESGHQETQSEDDAAETEESRLLAMWPRVQATQTGDETVVEPEPQAEEEPEPPPSRKLVDAERRCHDQAPLTSQSRNRATQTEENIAPTQTEEYVAPTQTEKSVAPTQTKEDVTPTQRANPTQTKEEVAPTQTAEGVRTNQDVWYDGYKAGFEEARQEFWALGWKGGYVTGWNVGDKHGFEDGRKKMSQVEANSDRLREQREQERTGQNARAYPHFCGPLVR